MVCFRQWQSSEVVSCGDHSSPNLNHTLSNHCIYQNQAVRPTRPLKINFPLTKSVILVPRRADLAVPLPCSPCHSPCHFRYWSTPIRTSSSPRVRGDPCQREDGGLPYRSELDHVASCYVTAALLLVSQQWKRTKIVYSDGLLYCRPIK